MNKHPRPQESDRSPLRRFMLCPPILQLHFFCAPLFSNTWWGAWSKIVTRISREVFKKPKLALPCSVAFTFFFASHARWRFQFRLFQPLYGQNARFAHGLTNWHSHAARRSIFFSLLMLGGVAFCCLLNPSAARMLIWVMGCRTGAPTLRGVYFFCFSCSVALTL